MSLTKIGSIGINTGIAFAGVTTIVTLNTANDALSIGATVNVGSGITLGASGDIFATGVSTVTTLKVGSGVTVSSDGDIFATGVTTATTFSGSGANLTNLPAANLTGTLPAISGANLTNLDASDLASGTVPTARLGSGTASSSTFLRGDSTFQTVNTDLVSDTSPQLGGNLDTNGNNIDFADGNQARFGNLNTGDLYIYHDSADSYINNVTGTLYTRGDTISLNAMSTTDKYLQATNGGSVDLYYDNSKKFQTYSSGIQFFGNIKNETDGTNQGLFLGAANDFQFYHDGNRSAVNNRTGELRISAADNIRLGYAAAGNTTSIDENYAVFKLNGAVELFHDNTKQCETSANGLAFPSGKGIDFSATGDTGGMTNELLDDYEEGTFTPDWKGGSALGTTSYGSHNIGAYTKIGNLVTVTGKSDITGTSGGSGFWFIGNMPFNVASGQEHNTVGAVRLDYFTFSSGDKKDVTDIITTMDQNNNNMHIHNIRHDTFLGSNVGANVDANFTVYWCITYRTA